MFISRCSKCTLLTCLAHFFHKQDTGLFCLVHIFNFFWWSYQRFKVSRRLLTLSPENTIRTLVQQNRSDPRTTLCTVFTIQDVYCAQAPYLPVHVPGPQREIPILSRTLHCRTQDDDTLSQRIRIRIRIILGRRILICIKVKSRARIRICINLKRR